MRMVNQPALCNHLRRRLSSELHGRQVNYMRGVLKLSNEMRRLEGKLANVQLAA